MICGLIYLYIDSILVIIIWSVLICVVLVKVVVEIIYIFSFEVIEYS